MAERTPAALLEGFLAKYSPEIAALGRASLRKMRRIVPGWFEMVYDNYNALVIGFSPTERPSDAVFSIALYPRWVNLFFLQVGDSLHDPHKLLKGSGNIVRSLRLESAADLEKPAVRALMKQALEDAGEPPVTRRRGQLVIRSISAKQRPRRTTKGS